MPTETLRRPFRTAAVTLALAVASTLSLAGGAAAGPPQPDDDPGSPVLVLDGATGDIDETARATDLIALTADDAGFAQTAPERSIAMSEDKLRKDGSLAGWDDIAETAAAETAPQARSPQVSAF